MRVTDSYVQRSYLNNNNRALENQLKYQNRVLTQKAFTRASEDSVAANTAMKIRKNLENLDMYDNNLNTAHELFDAAETNLYNITGNIYQKVNTLVVSVQDTLSQMEFDAIALDLEERAKEMMSSVNCDFGGRQLFAGTSNNKEPFTIKYYMTDDDGNLIKTADGKPIEVPDDRHQVGDMELKAGPMKGFLMNLYGGEIYSDCSFMSFNIGENIYTAKGTDVYVDKDGNSHTIMCPDDLINNMYNASTGEKVESPFAYDKDGKLVYNGSEPVNSNDYFGHDLLELMFTEATTHQPWGSVVVQPGTVAVRPYARMEWNIAENKELKSLEFEKEDGTTVTISGTGWMGRLTYKDLDESEYFSYDEETGILSFKSTEPLKPAEGNTDTADFIKDKFGFSEFPGKDTPINRKAVVCFNGTDTAGYTGEGGYSDPTQYNGGKDGGIYIDVGLGVNYDKNGNIIKSTAMDIALNGAAMTGCGVDKDGDSKNIIQLTFDAAEALNRGDLEKVNRLIDKLANAQKTVLSSIVTLGTKQNDIDFYLDKNEDYRMNLLEKQNKTEGCDLTKEITNLESAKAAYSAALQIGASTVPNSIFDFIR